MNYLFKTKEGNINSLVEEVVKLRIDINNLKFQVNTLNRRLPPQPNPEQLISAIAKSVYNLPPNKIMDEIFLEKVKDILNQQPKGEMK